MRLFPADCTTSSMPLGYSTAPATVFSHGPGLATGAAVHQHCFGRAWPDRACEVHPADLDGAQGIALALDKLPMAFSVELALLQSVVGKLWVRHALRDAHRATACYYSLHYLLHLGVS